MSSHLQETPTQDTLKTNQDLQKTRKSLRCAVRNQVQFTVSCLDDLIPEDHRVRDVWDYVCQLDTANFLEPIKVTEGFGGPRTADPRILLALWLYATLQGIVSARCIDRLCKEHHAYIWLCGGVTVNYHTLSTFRAQNIDGFHNLLKESIAVLWKSGIFSPEQVAQDGTRVKANAGFSKYRTEKTLDRYLEEANEYIKSLEAEHKQNPSAANRREKSLKEKIAKERMARIKQAKNELESYKEDRIVSGKKNHNKLTQEDLDKIRGSITDPECRKMKMGDGGFRLAYNVQFATTTDKNVIVGVDVVNTLDPGTLAPMQQQVHDNLKEAGSEMPKKWLVDSAYANNEDVDLANEKFPDTTIYSSPTSTNKNINPLEPRKNDKPAMVELRTRMKSNEAQQTYKQRGQTAEFPNAVTKNRGMKEFLVRGLSKAKNMALLYAVMHNMMVYFRNV